MISIVHTALGSSVAIGDRARLTVQRYLDDAIGDAPLAIPWCPAGQPVTPLDLLAWRSRDSPMVGHERDETDLLEWAHDGDGCRIRILTGPAGAGKSRIAAEAARILQGEGWTAGVAGWNDGVVWRLGDAGTFVIVDEPPAALGIDWDALPALVEGVVRPSRPVRVLVLSRACPVNVRDLEPVWSAQHIRPLSLEAAAALHERLVERYVPAGVARPARAFNEWSASNRVAAQLPLYAIATALHVCQPLWDGQYAEDGHAAIAGVVHATWRTLSLEGERVGLAADVLPLLVALGNACGGLDENDLRRLAGTTSLTMAEPQSVIDRVERLPMWWRGRRLAMCWDGPARGAFLRVAFDDAEHKGLNVRVAAGRPITSIGQVAGVDRDLLDAGASARLCRFLGTTLPVRDLDLDLRALDRNLRPGSLLGRLALRAAERDAPAIPAVIGPGGADGGHADALFRLARHLTREEGAEAAIEPAREAVRLYRELVSRHAYYQADLDDAVALLRECVTPRR